MSQIEAGAKLCGEDCEKKLHEHIEICNSDSRYKKCTENYVAYDCRFKENGKCEHYYEIEELQPFFIEWDT